MLVTPARSLANTLGEPARLASSTASRDATALAASMLVTPVAGEHARRAGAPAIELASRDATALAASMLVTPARSLANTLGEPARLASSTASRDATALAASMLVTPVAGEHARRAGAPAIELASRDATALAASMLVTPARSLANTLGEPARLPSSMPRGTPARSPANTLGAPGAPAIELASRSAGSLACEHARRAGSLTCEHARRAGSLAVRVGPSACRTTADARALRTLVFQRHRFDCDFSRGRIRDRRQPRGSRREIWPFFDPRDVFLHAFAASQRVCRANALRRWWAFTAAAGRSQS